MIKNASAINDLDGNGPDAGDRIDYTFIVSNEGNQTLTNLTISDAKVSVTPCAVTSLAPATATNCTAVYTLLQSDIDAGSVSNTGNQTLTGITVSDVKATVLGGPLATLPPATTDTSTFTATYVLTTQADIDAGNVTNTASVRGNPPTGPPVGDTSGTSSSNDLPTDTPILRAPALTLVKTAAAPATSSGANATLVDVGDTVAYHYCPVVNRTNSIG